MIRRIGIIIKTLRHRAIERLHDSRFYSIASYSVTRRPSSLFSSSISLSSLNTNGVYSAAQWSSIPTTFFYFDTFQRKTLIDTKTGQLEITKSYLTEFIDLHLKYNMAIVHVNFFFFFLKTTTCSVKLFKKKQRDISVN